METVKRMYEGKTIPLLTQTSDFSNEVYQEANEVISAAIDSNSKMDAEGMPFCDLEVSQGVFGI